MRTLENIISDLAKCDADQAAIDQRRARLESELLDLSNACQTALKQLPSATK